MADTTHGSTGSDVVADHGASHGHKAKRLEVPPQVLSWAWIVFLMLGIAIPAFGIGFSSFSEWLHTPSFGFGFAKVCTSLCWFIVGLTGIVNAISRIKDSEETNTEWFGCVELVLSSMLLFATFLVSSTSPETFTGFQKLLVPSRKPAMEDKVENLKYDYPTPIPAGSAATTPAVESGKVSWDMDGTALWVVINVDYKNGEPVKRQSILKTHINQDADGKSSYVLDEQDRPRWERIGVFYGTSNGPSEEAVIFRKVESPKKESSSDLTTVESKMKEPEKETTKTETSSEPPKVDSEPKSDPAPKADPDPKSDPAPKADPDDPDKTTTDPDA